MASWNMANQGAIGSTTKFHASKWPGERVGLSASMFAPDGGVLWHAGYLSNRISQRSISYRVSCTIRLARSDEFCGSTLGTRPWNQACYRSIDEATAASALGLLLAVCSRRHSLRIGTLRLSVDSQWLVERFHMFSKHRLGRAKRLPKPNKTGRANTQSHRLAHAGVRHTGIRRNLDCRSTLLPRESLGMPDC